MTFRGQPELNGLGNRVVTTGSPIAGTCSEVIRSSCPDIVKKVGLGLDGPYRRGRINGFAVDKEIRFGFREQGIYAMDSERPLSHLREARNPWPR